MINYGTIPELYLDEADDDRDEAGGETRATPYSARDETAARAQTDEDDRVETAIALDIRLLSL